MMMTRGLPIALIAMCPGRLETLTLWLHNHAPGPFLATPALRAPILCVADHRLRMVMRDWKRASVRPCLECVSCGFYFGPRNVAKCDMQLQECPRA